MAAADGGDGGGAATRALPRSPSGGDLAELVADGDRDGDGDGDSCSMHSTASTAVGGGGGTWDGTFAPLPLLPAAGARSDEFRVARRGAARGAVYVHVPWPTRRETQAQAAARLAPLLAAAAAEEHVMTQHGVWLLPQHGPSVHSPPDASGARVWRAYTSAAAAVDGLLRARVLRLSEEEYRVQCGGVPPRVMVPYSVARAVAASLRGTAPSVPEAAWQAASSSARAAWAAALADEDALADMVSDMGVEEEEDCLAHAVAATRIVALSWRLARQERAPSMLW